MCIFRFICRKNILLLSKIMKTQFVSENLGTKTPRKNNFIWVITHELKDVLSGSISPFLWKSILLHNIIIKIDCFPYIHHFIFWILFFLYNSSKIITSQKRCPLLYFPLKSTHLFNFFHIYVYLKFDQIQVHVMETFWYISALKYGILKSLN